MAESIPAKKILQKVRYDKNLWFGIDYTANLYHGCPHGCIYCDSRSERYRIEHFDQVRFKENAIPLLYQELRLKRQKHVIGLGAMSDPYNPLEEKLLLTKQALECIAETKNGISVDTKSNLIIRDIPLLQNIAENHSAIVKLTITTANDTLGKKIEPNAPFSSERFEAVKRLNEAGIICGILLTPILPFLTDREEDIKRLIEKAHQAGAKFIYAMYGVTLRDRQRAYFYEQLREMSPALVERYQSKYGLRYLCETPNKTACWATIQNECSRYGILTDMTQIIQSYQKQDGYPQLSLF